VPELAEALKCAGALTQQLGGVQRRIWWSAEGCVVEAQNVNMPSGAPFSRAARYKRRDRGKLTFPLMLAVKTIVNMSVNTIANRRIPDASSGSTESPAIESSGEADP